VKSTKSTLEQEPQREEVSTPKSKKSIEKSPLDIWQMNISTSGSESTSRNQNSLTGKFRTIFGPLWNMRRMRGCPSTL